MPWVRLHDGAIRHPKIVGLLDWNNAFCVWMWCLSYVQEHLTDGRIIRAAFPTPKALKTAARLVAAGLLEDRDGAFFIHDYADWNDVRDVVLEKRASARGRVAKYRSNALQPPLPAPTVTRDVTRDEQRTSSSGVGLPVPGGTPKGESLRGGGQQHGRLHLHRWQIEELINALGPHVDGFDLDLWLDGLSAQLDAEGLALVAKERWSWVQSQLVRELERRGIKRAVEGTVPAQKTTEPQWTGWACPHTPACDGRWQCAKKTEMETYRAAEARGE